MGLVIGKIGYGEKVHAAMVYFVNNEYKPGTQMRIERFVCCDSSHSDLKFGEARKRVDEDTPATKENVTCEKCLKFMNN